MFSSRGPWACAFIAGAVFLLVQTSGALSGGHKSAETGSLAKADAALLAEVLAGDHRSDKNKARDKWRHPAETLAFFGVESGMTVVEIAPSAGWYTEVIAPYIKRGGGTFYAAHFDTSSGPAFFKNAVARFKETFDDKDLYGEFTLTAHGANVKQIAPDGSADVVLTFRNLHNWMPGGSADKIVADAYKALKPGGIFGVVDHRANDTETQDAKAANGRVREDYAIALIEKAGFELIAASDVNNNPNDTRDQPFGVWTLPPTLRNTATRGAAPEPDFDSAPYMAVGESDRFTLKFMKPVE